jgi:hypothetical protein
MFDRSDMGPRFRGNDSHLARPIHPRRSGRGLTPLRSRWYNGTVFAKSYPWQLQGRLASVRPPLSETPNPSR